jgi:hypothetical protein
VALLNVLKLISHTSRTLLVVTLTVSIGLFAINPFLVVSLPSYAGVTHVGLMLFVSMVAGSLIALLASGQSAVRHTAWLAQLSVLALTIGAIGLALLPSLPLSCRLIAAIVAMTFLRSGLNLYSNASRSLHLASSGSRLDAALLIAVVGTVFGIGSALGPLVAAPILDRKGFGWVLSGSAILFALSCLVIALGLRDRSVDHSFTDRPLTPLVLRPWPSTARVARLCFATALAFLLYAQSISYIPITIVDRFRSPTSLVALFFVVNALLLIVCSVPLMRAISHITPRREMQMTMGIGALAAGLVALRLGRADLLTLLVSALLYTAGEVVLPSVGLAMLHSATRDTSELSRDVAFFNFATNSLGLGAGQYIGVLVGSLAAVPLQVGAWLLLAALAVAVIRMPLPAGGGHKGPEGACEEAGFERQPKRHWRQP